jgi:polyphosphate glucokinase
MNMDILGIDIGGSGIKGAVVDTRGGKLLSERVCLATPQPATPTAVAEVVARLVHEFDWKGPIGCGFPAIISEGTALSAANIDSSWIGTDVEDLLQRVTDCQVFVVNDADAAGLAEICFGAGYEVGGAVLVLTLGTGIGSALFYQGELFPNLELGHLPLMGAPAEHYASAAVRTQEKLSWMAWSKRLNCFLAQVERLMHADLIIIGGGVSCQSEKFLPLLEARARLVPACLQNDAGIVGAASFAARHQRKHI